MCVCVHNVFKFIHMCTSWFRKIRQKFYIYMCVYIYSYRDMKVKHTYVCMGERNVCTHAWMDVCMCMCM